MTTVGELSRILVKLPPELPVLVSGYENSYEHFYSPYIKIVEHHPENPFYDGEYQDAESGTRKTIEALILQRIEKND